MAVLSVNIAATKALHPNKNQPMNARRLGLGVFSRSTGVFVLAMSMRAMSPLPLEVTTGLRALRSVAGSVGFHDEEHQTPITLYLDHDGFFRFQRVQFVAKHFNAGDRPTINGVNDISLSQ